MRRALGAAGRTAVVWVAVVAAGCQPSAPDAPPASASGTPQQALDACFLGDVETGLRLVAREAERDDVDALTARALCRWMAFAADSSQRDARGALADLDRAIEVATEQSPETPTDHLYAHRAFVRQATEPGAWDATLADLDAAARAAPSSARHVLDRAFVHLARADTAAAMADFERVELVDPRDTVRVTLARETLGELTGVPLESFYRAQETVVFED